jgi:hypothetical protein
VPVGRAVVVAMIPVLVDLGLRVAGTGVLVGRTVGVELGLRVAVRVAVGIAVDRVFVPSTNGVLVGVWEGVRVMVGEGVMDGVNVVVGEGPVAVGKGPRSAPEVSAMAIRVPLAFELRAAALGCTRNIKASQMPIRNRHVSNPSSTCGRLAYSVQRSSITALLLFGPGHGRKRGYRLGIETVMNRIALTSQRACGCGRSSGKWG